MWKEQWLTERKPNHLDLIKPTDCLLFADKRRRRREVGEHDAEVLAERELLQKLLLGVVLERHKEFGGEVVCARELLELGLDLQHWLSIKSGEKTSHYSHKNFSISTVTNLRQ